VEETPLKKKRGEVAKKSFSHGQVTGIKVPPCRRRSIYWLEGTLGERQSVLSQLLGEENCDSPRKNRANVIRIPLPELTKGFWGWRRGGKDPAQLAGQGVRVQKVLKKRGRGRKTTGVKLQRRGGKYQEKTARDPGGAIALSKKS